MDLPSVPMRLLPEGRGGRDAQVVIFKGNQVGTGFVENQTWSLSVVWIRSVSCESV